MTEVEPGPSTTASSVQVPRPVSQSGIPPGPPVIKTPTQKKSTGAMDWVEMMQNFIAKGRVKQAAIFDRKGKCFSQSKSDFQIPQDEVLSVVRCLDTDFACLNKPHFGLFFGEDRFLCFRADKTTVIGLTQTDFFVAHVCEDIVIFAFCDLKKETNLSCIGEVWTFAREVRSKMELSTFIG